MRWKFNVHFSLIAFVVWPLPRVPVDVPHATLYPHTSLLPQHRTRYNDYLLGRGEDTCRVCGDTVDGVVVCLDLAQQVAIVDVPQFDKTTPTSRWGDSSRLARRIGRTPSLCGRCSWTATREGCTLTLKAQTKVATIMEQTISLFGVCSLSETQRKYHCHNEAIWYNL